MRRLAQTDGPGSSGASRDDSLAFLVEQDRLLVKIFDGWHATSPPPDVDDTRVLVRSSFERGTYGKLLIEHAALRVAAKTDVVRILRDVGSEDLANDLARHLPEVLRILDRLDELARGVDAMGVAAWLAFAGAVGELAALTRADLDMEPARTIPGVEAALGDHRARLHSARWVRHHAPTHPGLTERWYARIPLVVRIQARYDRLRGYPWARNAPMSAPHVADCIETDP